MMVLGFRSDPNFPRFAIVSVDGENFILENAASDNRLAIPASISADDEAHRIKWLFQEIERIFINYPKISKVVIKSNEYARNETKSMRRSAFQDAVVMLYCAQEGVLVERRTYRSMPPTNSDAKRHAEERVDKTKKYWNPKMADAVNAAWFGARHS